MRKNGLKANEYRAGYLFILPNFIGFFVFVAVPVLAGLSIAFTNYDGFKKLDFVGLTNFLRLWTDDYFLISLKNNFYYTFTAVPLSIMIGLFLAIILNNKRLKMRTLFRSVFYFPNITSIVAIAIVWRMLYSSENGLINVMLMGLGIDNPPVWLGSITWAMPAVIIVNIWQSSGYFMVLLLAGLQGIPNHLYEAAFIDGANKMQKFWRISLPMLSPTLFLVVVLGIINSFKIFGIIHIMTEGGPGRATNVLVFRVYQEAFINYKFGYASSIAFVLFLIIFIITYIQFKGQKEWVNYI